MFNRTNPLSELLIAFFEEKKYHCIEPPVLQPTHAFTELSGEDIRRRLFITEDQTGQELCLRPEYTIPVALEHLKILQKHTTNTKAAYWYLGSVFRFRSDGPGEFLQAGLEIIGREDKTIKDAECVVHSIEGLMHLGVTPSSVMIGDMALLNALLDALQVSTTAKRQVLGGIVAGRPLKCFDLQDQTLNHEHAGLLATIEGQDAQSVKAFVEDILSIAGITRVGGRSAGEIAERFLSKASKRSILSLEQKDILEQYLSISGEPDEAVDAIHTFARDRQLDIAPALSDLETRIGFIAALQADLSLFRFEARFARNLDYYTGFIFEVFCHAHAKPVAGGGRYDQLFQHLSAHNNIPAVGCAFWLDRLLQESQS